MVNQTIQVTEDVVEPTVYVGQLVKIVADCDSDIAIIAQVGQVHGRVVGTVYFRGQTLVIEPEAEVQGDLDVKAQIVQVYGKVAGEITGNYQQLQDERDRESYD